jgi:hypothetical protein
MGANQMEIRQLMLAVHEAGHATFLLMAGYYTLDKIDIRDPHRAWTAFSQDEGRRQEAMLRYNLDKRAINEELAVMAAAGIEMELFCHKKNKDPVDVAALDAGAANDRQLVEELFPGDGAVWEVARATAGRLIQEHEALPVLAAAIAELVLENSGVLRLSGVQQQLHEMKIRSVRMQFDLPGEQALDG